MKRSVCVLIWSYVFLVAWTSYAQQSANVVEFQVTYDLATERYTAWLVPRYSLPNANNPGTNERGGTAQFTLKVPASFSIVEITDVKGVWDKAPLKLGPGNPGQDWSGSGLNPALNYYVIGKSPSETNYGSFESGTPVALFTFRGNGCFGPISPLEPGNPFIAQANARFALNVANSFYSISGQPPGGSQSPLEQFSTTTGPPAQCSSSGLQANPDNQTLTAGASVIIRVLDNDTRNAQPVSATSVLVTVTTPSSGTATVNADGTVRYTAAAGYVGPISFTYTICDQQPSAVCSSASVNLTVQPCQSAGRCVPLVIRRIR